MVQVLAVMQVAMHHPPHHHPHHTFLLLAISFNSFPSHFHCLRTQCLLGVDFLRKFPQGVLQVCVPRKSFLFALMENLFNDGSDAA